MNDWQESVRMLEEWQQIVLGAALVSRMAPNYALFCEVSDSGDSRVFNAILDVVWEFARGDNTRIHFDKQQDKLEAITPDPARFDVYGVWPALDATVALASLLGACERFSSDDIIAIATVSQSTISHFLEASGADHQQSQHPLLAADSQFCQQLVQRLKRADTAERRQVATATRQWVAGFEHSNIGLQNAD